MVERQNRIILEGKEVDILISSLGIAFEFNGLRWHSEEFGKDKNYHLNKLNECNKQGIKLIQIFEDEYVNNKGYSYDEMIGREGAEKAFEEILPYVEDSIVNAGI